MTRNQEMKKHGLDGDHNITRPNQFASLFASQSIEEGTCSASAGLMHLFTHIKCKCFWQIQKIMGLIINYMWRDKFVCQVNIFHDKILDILEIIIHSCFPFHEGSSEINELQFAGGCEGTSPPAESSQILFPSEELF